MLITNLTNSPYDLVNSEGKKVRLAARDFVKIEPHPLHVNIYRSLGYFKIEDDGPVKKVAVKKVAAKVEP